jgi:hypothetical protein
MIMKRVGRSYDAEGSRGDQSYDIEETYGTKSARDLHGRVDRQTDTFRLEYQWQLVTEPDDPLPPSAYAA